MELIGYNYEILEIPNITGSLPFKLTILLSSTHSSLPLLLIELRPVALIALASQEGALPSLNALPLIIFIWLSLYSPFNLLGGHNVVWQSAFQFHCIEFIYEPYLSCRLYSFSWRFILYCIEIQYHELWICTKILKEPLT